MIAFVLSIRCSMEREILVYILDIMCYSVLGNVHWSVIADWKINVFTIFSEGKSVCLAFKLQCDWSRIVSVRSTVNEW